MACVLLASAATATIDVLSGAETLPEAFSFKLQLSRDKADTDYVPLGKTLVNQPLRVEFGIEGAHVHHSASLNILPDWFNVAKDAADGAMTAYLEDNMQSHTNQRDHLEVVYGSSPTVGMTFVYLKLNPEYIANYCKKTACSDYDFTVRVTIRGGQDWISPATADGQDADEKDGVLPRGYQSAQIVRLGNLANGDTFTVNFEEDDWKQDNYIPVGRFSMLDVVGFNVQFNGQGSSHNMNVEIFTDYMPVRTNTPLITHKGKMTAIISDSKTAVNQNKYLNIIYRQVPDTANIWVYLALDQNFITCGTSENCKNGQRSARIQPTNAPFSFVSAKNDNGVDADFDKDLYLPATKVELAKVSAGDSKWTVDLTTSKQDTDYVALGAVRLTEATSFKIGVVGWGTSHSLIVDVTTDWFNEEARGNAANSATIFIKDTKSHLQEKFQHCKDDVCETRYGQHDPYEHWQIKYGHSDARDMIWFYLQIDPEYFGCDYYAKRDDDPSIAEQCKAASHKVQVHASGGISYVAGNVEGGFDPKVASTMSEDKKYFTAIKIDVGAIPALEERLAAAETNLTAADEAVAGLQTANAEQDKTIADMQAAMDTMRDASDGHGNTAGGLQDTIDAMQKAMNAQGKLIADLQTAMGTMSDGHGSTAGGLQDQLDKLTAWMMSAPVPADKEPASCAGNECVPNIDSVDGSSLALSASGGAVTFTSGGCKEATDLCDLARDVDALKAKFSNGN